MTLAKSILQARHFGVRDYKAHITGYFRSQDPQIITVHGQPKKVVFEYSDILELMDIVEELEDKTLIQEIVHARHDYRNYPEKSVSAESIFKS